MTKKSKPRGQVTKTASAKQEAALSKIVEDVRRSERVQAGHGLLHDAYVGRLVEQVRNATTYGDSGVERLAERLQRSATSLYRLKDRVAVFDEEALAKAITSAQEHGFLLTGSLFDELAHADPRERDILLDSAIRERWSVRELHRQIHGDEHGPPRGATSTLPASTIIARSESLLQALRSIPVNDGSLLAAEERQRTVVVLAELTSAINDAIQDLVASGRTAS